MRKTLKKYMNSNLFFACIKIFVASLDSTAEIGHANGADWQEEIYQKVISVVYCSLDEVHVCQSLARFQWKRSPGIWYKGILFSYGCD